MSGARNFIKSFPPNLKESQQPSTSTNLFLKEMNHIATTKILIAIPMYADT